MNKPIARRQAHEIDRHVGGMLRSKRKAMRISQEALAHALGITFQQIQKYEGGINRISASKLYQASHALDAPLSSFFEGLDTPQGDSASVSTLSDFLTERGSHELMEAFLALDPAVRRRLVDLAKAMAEDGAKGY